MNKSVNLILLLTNLRFNHPRKIQSDISTTLYSALPIIKSVSITYDDGMSIYSNQISEFTKKNSMKLNIGTNLKSYNNLSELVTSSINSFQFTDYNLVLKSGELVEWDSDFNPTKDSYRIFNNQYKGYHQRIYKTGLKWYENKNLKVPFIINNNESYPRTTDLVSFI